MDAKVIILLIWGLLLNVYCYAQQTKNPKDQKPNFIFIVADDLGYGDLGFTGSHQIKTPNIDRLAYEGTSFTNGYVSSPVCSPSRAGFLTGRNQVSFGHDNNIDGSQLGFDPDFLGLPLSEKTIADRLKPMGYICGLVGKWHLGDKPQFHPLKRGFDEFWGYTGGGHNYFNSEPDGEGYLSPIECNYKSPAPITYLTDDKGKECVDFIRRHKNEPFFLFASFNAPHSPMQATEKDLALFSHIKDEKRRIYCAMVHRLDINVGRIIEAIKEEGLAENTLIAFISDNGGPRGNASVNAPFNGQKGILLEGGVRVPFILNWKGVVPSGKIYAHPVTSLDFAPTFVETAGGRVSKEDKMDGVNLIPYINGEKLGVPHQELKWRFTISAAIRDGDWKLVRLPDRLPMLYNLKNDISEQQNVALKNIEITRDLLKKLGKWDVEQPHPVFLEGAIWKGLQLEEYDKDYLLVQPK
ncbi:sulfatase-like hydrolase/transferase [Arenibacter sp. ARW7G5Y1]|uniref:sulfatase-like hydrolase/transferase n=1 Tax=Arenibacter sp. ARW7G5Y1 TaxID=2135619 RepID=UPI000D773747|nr:sulfatase-like hydrolase/transferase [Arenibacter sp. ARW7G5Y1]PXX23779.1 arylsulfatase A-like enzyme [Arenibacter sp. ARW7G5Y1]